MKKFPIFDYLCDKQSYCNGVLDFFPVNNFVHRMVNTTSDMLKVLKC